MEVETEILTTIAMEESAQVVHAKAFLKVNIVTQMQIEMLAFFAKLKQSGPSELVAIPCLVIWKDETATIIAILNTSDGTQAKQINKVA